MEETAIVRAERAGTLEALRPVAEAARDYAAHAKAENTLRAYRGDWRDFETWTAAHRLEALPATPETVALYAAALASRAKVATIRRRLATVSGAHRAAGFDSPTSSPAVSAVLAGIRRDKGDAQTRKAPAVTATLRRMAEALPAGLVGIRDRALLLVGFAGAFRRSELVGLRLEDVEFPLEGLVLTLRRSKTDQEGKGERVAIPHGANPETCPVRALSAWIEAAGISEGPLFRSVTRHGRISPEALSPEAVAIVVKRSASRVGLDPATFSGHSLRAGFATAAAQAEVPEWRIARQTRHRSLVILGRYIREANLFRKNAAAAVGL